MALREAGFESAVRLEFRMVDNPDPRGRCARDAPGNSDRLHSGAVPCASARASPPKPDAGSCMANRLRDRIHSVDTTAYTGLLYFFHRPAHRVDAPSDDCRSDGNRSVL